MSSIVFVILLNGNSGLGPSLEMEGGSLLSYHPIQYVFVRTRRWLYLDAGSGKCRADLSARQREREKEIVRTLDEIASV
jgi:hypothetical protein